MFTCVFCLCVIIVAVCLSCLKYSMFTLVRVCVCTCVIPVSASFEKSVCVCGLFKCVSVLTVFAV